MAVDESLYPQSSKRAPGDCAEPMEVERMTSEQFRAAIESVGFSLAGFARISGANHRTVERWADDQQDIPLWVSVLLRVMWLTTLLPTHPDIDKILATGRRGGGQ